MSGSMANGRCAKCLWEDICSFGQPCNYYTPEDIDDAIEKLAEKNRKARFVSDWQDYMEYCSDENIFF